MNGEPADETRGFRLLGVYSVMEEDFDDEIVWRFTVKKGPVHGYLKGMENSLCGMALWKNDQDKIDRFRRKCVLCKNTARVQGLKLT